jgi:hypothetical protein
MAAQPTRRALFAAPAVFALAALPVAALAQPDPKEDRWAQLTRSAAAMDHRTGAEVVATARILGFDPDNCSGLYKEFTHGRRLLIIFEPLDAPGEVEPIHVDCHGIVKGG